MKNFRMILNIAALASAFPAFSQERGDTTSLTIKESIVYANRNGRVTRAGTSSMEIPSVMITTVPALLGEPDLVKAVQLLPGVQSGTEGLSGMFVRGGGSDENLVLLDGVPVYTAGHMLGLFSAFQSEAVAAANVYKGAFPARFGGRASSVLDIKTADGVRPGGCLGVGALSDKFHFESPSPGGKFSVSISGRGTHTLLMDGALRALKVPGNFHFHDLHAKATARIGNMNTLTASYFSSKDNLYYKEGDSKTYISWGCSMGALTWKRIWGERLSSETILATSGHSLNMGRKTGLDDLIAKTGCDYEPSKGMAIRFGAEAIRHVFKPESDGDESSVVIKGVEASGYIEGSLEPAGWLLLEPGLRLSHSSAGRKGRTILEPRISVTTEITDWIEIKASYSRISQAIHQLSSPYAVLPSDMIVPVGGGVGPVISDQISLGFSRGVPGGWEISIEGFRKAMRGVLELRDGVELIDDFETWEEDVASGEGRAEGLELFVRKSVGKTTGWLGYTLSSSERRFPDGSVSGGNWFPSRYDRRHSVAAVLNRKFGEGWELGATWTYSTGGAMTVPEADGSAPSRGNVRLPPSHRLDLGMSHRKARKRGERIWNAGVYNAYNRKNPNLVFLTYDEADDGSGPSLKKISFLPLIPSVSYIRAF